MGRVRSELKLQYRRRVGSLDSADVVRRRASIPAIKRMTAAVPPVNVLSVNRFVDSVRLFRFKLDTVGLHVSFYSVFSE